MAQNNITPIGGKYITVESFDTYRSSAVNKIKSVSEQCGKLKAESFFYKNKYEQLASSILPANSPNGDNKIDVDLNSLVDQVINDTFNDHLRLLQQNQ
jgi:hypothetical protein